ncbi:MAG: hypothetical protein DLM72_08205 [Candidatus Nitrosopolaris wilkensis]|nr:MAG: hypothetical protein DLM72_08205 [Candidatus Nitrosopolaris wilkensis]
MHELHTYYDINMYTQEKIQRQKISEILAIVAMALVLIYIADAAVGQGKQGFLPMSAALRGMLFGATSIILFFLSFGIGIKEKSKITTILLIVGGAVIGTSVLGSVAMAKGGLSAIQSSFLVVVILGYIIMGLGIFRWIKKK